VIPLLKVYPSLRQCSGRPLVFPSALSFYRAPFRFSTGLPLYETHASGSPRFVSYVSYRGRVGKRNAMSLVGLVCPDHRKKELFDCSAKLFVVINFMNPYETWIGCSLMSVVPCAKCWMASDKGKCRFSSIIWR
jgi:hypothetical protein